MHNSLRRAAPACSLTVDPGVHGSLIEVAQGGWPPYVEACGLLQKARDAMERPGKFRFVHTCVMRGGTVYFILDPTPAGDADGDGVDDKAHLMQPYAEASPKLIATLTSGEVTVMKDPQSDPWGTFISGYAPITDASGKLVAAAGVDMDLAFYQGEIRDIRLATAAAALGALVVSLIAGYVMRHHERQLDSPIAQLDRNTGWRMEEVLGKTPGSFLQGPETSPATVQMMRAQRGGSLDELHGGGIGCDGTNSRGAPAQHPVCRIGNSCGWQHLECGGSKHSEIHL